MKKLIILFSVILIILLSSNVFSAPIFTDADCVGCHVFGTAINISITHPNLLIGCITCHGPENLGLHRDGIRQLDINFYNYTGNAANIGCGVCHSQPPFAVCLAGTVPDHCLDPLGCVPGIFNCINCHSNFNGLPTHIYPLSIPFSAVADISRCLLCHGLGLTNLLSGAHNRHLTTELMAPITTGSTLFSIDCLTCHPTLTANLGADHLVCIPGTSNANLPGIVPVVFNQLLPLIGAIDAYQLGPIGGTGSCVVYCHSNGATPAALSIGLGYPGSLGLPVAWNQIFPIDPVILNCIFCHAYPPGTHAPGQTNCENCHPTPVLATIPDNTYHINGSVDLLRFLLTNNLSEISLINSSPQNNFNNPLLSMFNNRPNVCVGGAPIITIGSPTANLLPTIWNNGVGLGDISPNLGTQSLLFSLIGGLNCSPNLFFNPFPSGINNFVRPPYYLF